MMIQRKKLTIFTDAKDNIPVHELKKIIACMYILYIGHIIYHPLTVFKGDTFKILKFDSLLLKFFFFFNLEYLYLLKLILKKL